MGAYNNEREIINSYVQKFNKNPAEWVAQKYEQLTGGDVDFSNRDHGEEPAIVESHEVEITDEELAKYL